MNVLIRQVCQFRTIVSNVVAIRIKLLGLAGRIEYSEIGRCIGAAAGDPLPPRAIVRQISIKQRVPEPGFSVSPVDTQMLNKKTGHNHSDPIVHVAGLPEFAHSRVHQGITGISPLPGNKVFIRCLPGIGVKLRLPVVRNKSREMIEQMVGEFPPSDFGKKLPGVLLN